MKSSGLFVGLITLDLLYRVPQLPQPNQKLVATDSVIAAGGPATNAAIAFRYLGNPATVLGVLGCHPCADLVRTDLTEYAVTIADLAPNRIDAMPVSSILVTEATGDRAVVSLNAVKCQADPTQIPSDILENVAIVLIDGHQMAVSQTIAQQARQRQIPIVLDGGSWKAGLETLLPLIDYAVCSANFVPPGCTTQAEVIQSLTDQGISQIAITRGSDPIVYVSGAESGQIAVPSIAAVDTLGAGDVFHGAFCHFIRHDPFTIALDRAAQLAAHSCQFFGPRRWMDSPLELS